MAAFSERHTVGTFLQRFYYSYPATAAPVKVQRISTFFLHPDIPPCDKLLLKTGNYKEEYVLLLSVWFGFVKWHFPCYFSDYYYTTTNLLGTLQGNISSKVLVQEEEEQY